MSARSIALSFLIPSVCLAATPKDAPNGHSFTDTRNGKTYRTVRIGRQTWMAENLNYRTGTSWCYDNDEANCTKWGRLYAWDTAKVACPEGWHLPSDKEWKALDDIPAEVLRSEEWVGTDETGFGMLPSGMRVSDGASTLGGSYASFWSSTRSDASNAWYRGHEAGNPTLMRDEIETTGRNPTEQPLGLSVRCLKDSP